jgi:NAD(P)-dependent dehydrogenase (short-subunit alcohol dehydrogenase family)
MLLKDKSCIIAGAASPKGIGRATAMLFAQHGARLILTDRTVSSNAVEAFKESVLRELGMSPDLIAIACDITEPTQCAEMVSRAESEFGVIDILVNSAGAVETRALLDTSADDLSRMIDANLKGAFNLCQAVLGHFARRKSGVIVNLASLAAQRGGGLVGGAHYASAKGGVISLTRAIAREFGPLGIRANVICPAMAQTAMLEGIDESQLVAIRETIPLRRFADASEVAGACLFLASELSSFVTGATLDVNGGLHIR